MIPTPKDEETPGRPLAAGRESLAFPAGPPTWPIEMPEVRQALLSLLADGSWGRYDGPHGAKLVERLGQYHQLPEVKLCSSGTVGIELALRGLGVAAGDEVALAAYDFPGNFRAVERVGARPVLVDIERHTLAVDPKQLERATSDSMRAVIVSHLHSGVANMPAIMQWAAAAGMGVVEDCCQAPGARVHGRVAGQWGDIAVLSFGGSKLVTAGRGGAVLTRRPEYLQRIRVFAEQGNDAYPLSELQAAVVLPQWERLDERNAVRRANVRILVQHLSDSAAIAFAGDPAAIDAPSYYKTAWWWNDAGKGYTRQQFAAWMRADGVAMDTGFRGFLKRSQRRCRRVGALDMARTAAEQLVVLHHPVLLEPADAMARVAHAVRRATR